MIQKLIKLKHATIHLFNKQLTFTIKYIDTMVSVIRMVAIGLHSVSEMKNSMDLEKLLIPTQESPLSHNGSPLTVLQMVT